MPICVELASNGTLIPTGQAVSECTGYVLVSGSEHAVYGIVAQALAMPTPEQAAMWVTGTCGAVIFWYLVARMAGSVANFFSR